MYTYKFHTPVWTTTRRPREYLLALRSAALLRALPCPAPVIPVEHKATSLERFMLKTKSVPDGTAKEWLQDKGKLARFEGDKRRWTLTLQTVWNMSWACRSKSSATRQLSSLPTAPTRSASGGSRPRRSDALMCDPNARHRRSAGLSLENQMYFRSTTSFNLSGATVYAQMLALPEFSDALIEFWPRALKMTSQDPEDLTVAADDVLSGPTHVASTAAAATIPSLTGSQVHVGELACSPWSSIIH